MALLAMLCCDPMVSGLKREEISTTILTLSYLAPSVTDACRAIVKDSDGYRLLSYLPKFSCSFIKGRAAICLAKEKPHVVLALPFQDHQS